jgi:hypothetical protein
LVKEEMAFVDSRAEAKRAAEERMRNLRSVDSVNNENRMNEQSAGVAEPKQSAFNIAVSVANEYNADAKADKKKSQSKAERPERSEKEIFADDEARKFRLLGDLPSLGPNKDQQKRDVKIALSIQHDAKSEPKPTQFMKPAASSKGSSNSGNNNSSSNADPSIPKEFLCAINGHVMKEPMRCASTGLVFETATILLWLRSNGQVCPISHGPMDKQDLEADDALRSKIKRYHIQQTQTRSKAQDEDDLYDF